MANTVSVTTGSDVVNGTLTQFVTAPGDTIVINGLSAKIKRQEHSGRLILDKPWPGPPATDATHWDILKTSSYWHSTQSLAQRVIELINRVEAGMPFKPDAFGTTSGRAQYNDQDAGFIYMATDVSPVVLYLKRSITAGDWGTPIQVQGPPGERGDPGPSSVPVPSFTTQVQTLPAGQNATATVSGTYPNLTLSLGIPQGAGGQTGPQGTVFQSVTYTGSRALALADANKRVRMESASAVNLTVPNNSAVPFPIDTEVQVFCAGEGDVTIVPATGVTLVPSTGLTLTQPGQWLTLKKVTLNGWDVALAIGTTTTTPPPTTVTLGTLSLSSSVIPENSPVGTLVGAIIGKTPNSTLSLPGDGGGRFRITGSNIEVASTAIDYETAPSHQITIRETLAGATNTPRDTTLTITVQDVQEGIPASLTALTLSASTIPENSPEGTLIGAINGRTIGSAITLANNAGGRVKLSGTNLVAGPTNIDYEATPSFQVVLRETLAGALNSPRDTTVTVTVQNVAEGGSLVLSELSLTKASIASFAQVGTVVGTVQRATAGSTLTMATNGGGRFELVGSDVRYTGAAPLDWSASSNHIITLRETIAGAVNSPRDTTFRIAVSQISNEVLSPLRLQPNLVAENVPPGDMIGTILDISVSSTLTLVNDAGGKVQIQGGNLLKVGPAGLDYETAASFDIVVREAVLEGMAPRQTTLTVNVADVAEGGTTPDTSPNAFTIPQRTGVEPNTAYISDPFVITGISAATPISVSSGLTYSIDSGAFTSQAGTVLNNASVRVQMTSSASYSTSKSLNVTVGDKTAAFTLVTRANSTQPATDVSIAPMTVGPWKCTMPYNSSGAASGTAVEVWPPALATTDNQFFDRQADGSIIFTAPTTGARTSGSSYVRCELRQILADGSNEYEWLPSAGGKLECTCAVLELPTMTKSGNGRRVIIGQIHGPNDEPCRLYYWSDGSLWFADDKAGSGQTETFFQLKDSGGNPMNIPLGSKFTYAIEMDTTGIRVQAVHNSTLYTAFSPLSSFWPGKLMYFKAGAYNGVGFPGQGSTNEGSGQSRVQFWRILNPKHPHTISGNALNPSAGSGSSPTLNALSVGPSLIPENSPAGTMVGTIGGVTAGSTLSLTDNAGGRFAISGNQIVTGSTPTDYETTSTHQITIRETLVGATNTPRDTTVTITVTDTADSPALAALGLSSTTVTSGAAQGTVVGAITGRTSGSTLALADSAGGRFALSGTNIVTGSVLTDVSTAAAHQIIVTETLAGATNSPRQTAMTITVAENLPALPGGQAFVVHTNGAYVMYEADHVTTLDTGNSNPTPPVGAGVVRTHTATSGETAVTSLAVTLATSPTPGSLLIACFAPDKNAGTFTAPSGWTQIVQQSGLTSISGVLYWKRATGSETSVTGSWTGSCRASAMVVEVANVNGALSLPYKHTTAATADTAVTTMSMQPAADPATGEFVMAFALVDNFNSVTTPSWTNGYTAHPTRAGSGSAAGIFAATKTVFSGGSYDTGFSFTGTADQMFGFICSFGLEA